MGGTSGDRSASQSESLLGGTDPIGEQFTGPPVPLPRPLQQTAHSPGKRNTPSAQVARR